MMYSGHGDGNPGKNRHSFPKLKASVLALALAAGSSAVQADLARVGPANIPSPPGHGFPLWYQDLNGTVLDLCLPNGTDQAQQAACLFAPPNPNAAWAFPSNFPDEAFYFDLSRVGLPVLGTTATFNYLMALEAAFATGGPVAGQQIVFARIRIRAGVPQPGTYTVTHPYGVEAFEVTSTGDVRDINFTDDVGITPGVFTGALTSRLGPFLRHADAPGGNVLPPIRIPAVTGPEFLSDGATLEFVTGSPFNTNYVMLCGVDPSNAPIALGDFGPGGPGTGNCAGDNTFTLVGRLHNLVANPIGSPLAVTRATYGRDGSGTHVDVNANVVKATNNQPNPVLTAASANQVPVLMTGPTILGDYYAQGITDPSGALPNAVTVTNSADSPPSTVTKNVVDVVEVGSANYNSGIDTLTVVATSSDKGFDGSPPPSFALEGFPGATVTPIGGSSDPADVTITATGVATPPISVSVLSSAGGIGRADVVSGLASPAYPPGVVFTQDDAADATASGGAVVIAVLANDLANPAAPAQPATVAILAPGLPAANGSLAVNTANGDITFTPSAAAGSFTFQYTVRNVVGTSNPATVTLNVAPPAGGSVPIATADPGPNNVNPNAILNISIATLLANDSGNGGTLDPASFQLVAGSVTGGSASISAGNVVYTAGATPGTFGFDYTVANTVATGGIRSAPAHVTVTIVSEGISVTTSRCTRSGNNGQWNVRGTDSIFPGTVITLFASSTAGSGAVIGSATVDATGGWRFTQTVNVACRSPISLRSSLGTSVNNIGIRIQ